MVKKKKLNKILIMIFLTILFFLSFLYFQSQYILKQVTSAEGYVQMKVKDIVFQNDIAFIILFNKCYELEFYTTPQQAESIIIGIENKTMFRPTSHDTIKSILETYKIKPIIVKITRMEQGTYFAEMTFQRGFEFVTIDIKPSDAIAIAARANTPIFVNESLAKNFC
ncbi:MAG: bifunctional nuclease family protein [Candidatus Aenigmatarchaeota archaeon]